MLTEGSSVEKLRWSFKLYDKDKDGAITRGEMLEIMQVGNFKISGHFTILIITYLGYKRMCNQCRIHQIVVYMPHSHIHVWKQMHVITLLIHFIYFVYQSNHYASVSPKTMKCQHACPTSVHVHPISSSPTRSQQRDGVFSSSSASLSECSVCDATARLFTRWAWQPPSPSPTPSRQRSAPTGSLCALTKTTMVRIEAALYGYYGVKTVVPSSGEKTG